MNQKFDRYRQLLGLAFEIIHDEGLLFFLRSAYLEFKRNRFKILESEKTLIEEFTEKESSHVYSEWLKHQESSHAVDKIRNNIISSGQKLSFDIIVLANVQNVQGLKKTINSIQDQTEINLKVHIFGSGKKKIQEIKKTSQLQIIFEEDEFLNSILKETDSSYLLFTKAGCILSKNSLLELDHFLISNPDCDIVYSDEDQIDSSGTRINPFFKPDWSPELFTSMDYFTNFFGVNRRLLSETNGDVINYYDFLLKLSEKTTKIYHLPLVLVSVSGETINSNKFEEKENIKALQNAVDRRKIKATINDTKLTLKDHPYSNTYRVTYHTDQNPMVSIIIPTKNNKKLLERCISKINFTSYKNFEIIIIDNGNTEKDAIDYLKSLSYRIVKFDSVFNFAAMNNAAATVASGNLLLFINDDVAPIYHNWLEEMVSICLQDGVGIVGPKLVYSNGSIQHAGLIFSKNGAGYHPYQLVEKSKPGYFGFLNCVRNYSAVTGACLLIRKNIFEKVGGFDEKLDVYYNDADLCLKTLRNGHRVVYTPYAELLHEGSTTMKKDSSAFFAVENHYYFIKKWPHLKKGDPFYNPNLGWNYKIDTNYQFDPVELAVKRINTHHQQ